ncbi:hypothetical protein RchiOBHm_Chr6g0301201 [Rosa chinensis]|uniref:Uncharacterized protein n=1 Tax=Rosa chinensis TaxID=74649 RepID=A0A2P6PYP2_ROSCH|nr:hypothetical protein RchiOBHm_Chr6g0301201 [Rosa chinensis]
MAKTSFVFIFALVLIISVHIHSVFGDEDKDMIDKASDAAGKAKNAAENFGHKASNAAQEARETGSSWADWFKGKFSDMGGDDDADSPPGN